MKGALALSLFAALFGGRYAQEACEWYYWTPTDWPDGSGNWTQDFEEVLRRQGMERAYLDSSDFQSGGEWEGQEWEDVFWTGVNRTASPPTSYFRPLGFRYARLGAWNDPTVCLQAWNVTGYKVELMIYTLTPEASLCMTDVTADAYAVQDTGAVSSCDSGYLYNCFTADTDQHELKVAVYCQTNCEDGSNVHMLWRFRRSGLTWDDPRQFTSDNPEMWCNMIASDIEWPDEIAEELPDNYQAVSNIGGASMLSTMCALFAGILVVFYY